MQAPGCSAPLPSPSLKATAIAASVAAITSCAIAERRSMAGRSGRRTVCLWVRCGAAAFHMPVRYGTTSSIQDAASLMKLQLPYIALLDAAAAESAAALASVSSAPTTTLGLSAAP